MEQLTRKPFVVNCPNETAIDPLREQLARKAQDLFLYRPLMSHLYGNVERQLKLGLLAAALQRLGIEPFDPEQVALYKVREAQTQNQRSHAALPRYVRFWLRLDRMLDAIPEEVTPLSIAAILLMVGSCLFGIVVLFNLLLEPVFSRQLSYLPLPGLALVSLFILRAWMRPSVRKYRRTEWEWKQVPLGHTYYISDPIPDFALDTAVRLKEAIPEAEFCIESLQSEDLEIGRVYADPFLVVDYAGERLYLEVWDEPKFEAMVR